MRKRLFSVLLALAVAFTATPMLAMPVFADDQSESDYVNGYMPIDNTYMMGDTQMVKDTEPSGAPSGLKGGSGKSFPEMYRSDKEPWAEGIAVKDQKKTSLCWAFSMTTAAEYSYAKEVYDETGKTGVVKELSPGHIAQFFYNRVKDPLGNTYGDSNDLSQGYSWVTIGGNQIFGVQHLATWSGEALEEKYPIDAINDHVITIRDYNGVWDGTDRFFPAKAAYDDELVQQESIMITRTARNTMRELILKYGALSASMEFDWKEYMNTEEINPETGKPYQCGRSFYNYNDSFRPDHAVTIVGWDDNYPKENFAHVIASEVQAARKAAQATAETEARARAEAEAEEIYSCYLPGRERLIEKYVQEHLDEYIAEIVEAAAEEASEKTRKKTTPKSDGAWIVQNSWSEECNDHGFFYVSYEDIDFCNDNDTELFAFDMQSADTYKYNFQYDGNAGIADASDRTLDGGHLDFYTKPGSRAANVYTNNTGEPLNIEAVGFTTFTQGVQSYEISVYTDLADPADPSSGKCQGTTEYSTETKGCKTAVLDEPVYIAPGSTYSIVFDFTDYSAFGFETDLDYNWLVFEAEIEPGQSFFSKGKSSKWTDMYEYDACFRIKGFANPTDLIPDKNAPSQVTPAAAQTPAVTASAALPASKISKVKSGRKSVTVKWNRLSAESQISGYEIQYSTSKSFSKGVKTVYAGASSESKKIKGLKAKKKYYVRVRSYADTAGGTQTSAWSQVRSVKAK